MWRTVGQERLIRFLTRSFKEKKLSHAYLFLGPEGVGKGTLAQDFAAALNCLSEEPPCDNCSSCRRIRAGMHPDVVVTEAIQKEIGIEQIRWIIASAYLPPYEGRYKVFVIDGAESFSPEAANCLLKTLEEPPPRVIFLLLAQEERELLPTLVSRCHCLRLMPLSRKMVHRFLKERGLPEEEAEVLSRLCGGCLGKATEEFLGKRKSWLEDLRRLFYQGMGDRFALAEELVSNWEKDSREVLEELSFWQVWWHDLLLFKVGLEHLVSNIDAAKELKLLGGYFSLGQLKAGWLATQKAAWYLKLNAHPRLVFHTLMLSLPQAIAREGTAATGGTSPDIDRG